MVIDGANGNASKSPRCDGWCFPTGSASISFFFPKSVKQGFDEGLAGGRGPSLRQQRLPPVYSCHGADHDLTLALWTNPRSTRCSNSNHHQTTRDGAFLSPFPSSYRCCAGYRCCLEKLSPLCIHIQLLLSSFADVVCSVLSLPSSRLSPPPQRWTDDLPSRDDRTEVTPVNADVSINQFF